MVDKDQPSGTLQSDFDKYAEWAREYYAIDDLDRDVIRTRIRRMERPSLFSIVILPTAEFDAELARVSIRSIVEQLYPHWELWLPDLPHESEAKIDRRSRLIPWQREPDTIFNSALAKAAGDFVLPLLE